MGLAAHLRRALHTVGVDRAVGYTVLNHSWNLLVRPVSLSLRLAINMTAGHIMLKTFAGFVITLGLLGVGPFALTIALSGLELAIAFLQAYVFAVLTCIYLQDTIHLH